jgi:hypothetical protein
LEVTRTRLLFSAIAAAELAHAFVATLQHRVPAGHDGFQFFTLQYYFLNNAVQAHEVAQWVPYMNQGTVASIWHGIQATLLQSVAIHLPWLPPHKSLLAVFHFGMFVDAMVLLTGTWLLARRFFSTPAVFFVAVSVVGSSVWLDQPYWNFRLYYAIPLMLELGHRFLDTGHWRWCFLMLNLLAVQMMGNLPYVIPVVSFVVFAYFLAYAGVSPRDRLNRLHSLQWRWPAVAAIGGGVLSLAAVYRIVTFGTEQLVSYNSERNPDGTNSLHTFLTYGESTDAGKWIDAALNLSPWMDFTLYAGILILPLLCLTIAGINRRQLHFAITALVVLLFSLATPLTAVLFYVWPGMKYFRHVGLVSPIVRVLVCFTAGIGFDWLIHQRGRRLAAAGVLLSIALIAIGWFAFNLSLDHPRMWQLVDTISNRGVGRPAHVSLADMLARRLWHTSLIAGVATIAAGFGAIVLSTPWFSKRPGASAVWVSVVLLLIAVEIYVFKFAYLIERSEVVPQTASFVTRPAAMTFPARREVNLKLTAVSGTNPRLSATLEFSQMFGQRLQGRSWHGAQYWTNNMFVFADEAGSTFQVDSWLRPFDQLIRMYWRWPIHDTSGFPDGVNLNELTFPLDHPGAGRITGVTADKLRFFSRAYTVDSVDALPALMTDPDYAGNILLITRTPTDRPTAAESRSWQATDLLSTDDSRQLSYHVDEFDANTLLVTVSNPGPAVWMLYADMWHPQWRASVNGKSVAIYRANLAYKAVPLEPGRNVVEFRFSSSGFAVLAALLAANAAFWIAATGWLATTITDSAASRLRHTATQPSGIQTRFE